MRFGDNYIHFVQRFTSASLASTWSESYSYDRYGNRAVTGRTGSLPSLSLETPSAVTDYNASTNRIGTTGFNYDPRGFVITTPSRSDIEYDKADRQIAVTFLGNTTYSYYDPEDRRAAKCNSSWTLCDIYFYDAFGRLAEIFDWSNYNDYIYGLGLLATDGGTWESGTTLARRYVTADQVGSKRLVTDASGSTLTTHDYLPFGEEIGGSGCGTLQSGAKFTGQYRDQETCQDYFMARYLTPASGRFMTPDEPLLDQWAGDGQSWNLYGYVRNNPLSYIDPTGTDTIGDCSGSSEQTCISINVTRSSAVPWDYWWDCRSLVSLCIFSPQPQPPVISDPPSPTPPITPPIKPPTLPKLTQQCTPRQAIIDEAAKWQGTPYSHVQPARCGINGDCSGTVSAIYRNVGINIKLGSTAPTGSAARGIRNSPSLSLTSAPQPGDIVYWSAPFDHSMIFAGNGSAWGARKPEISFGLYPLSYFGTKGTSPDYLSSPQVCK